MAVQCANRYTWFCSRGRDACILGLQVFAVSFWVVFLQDVIRGLWIGFHSICHFTIYWPFVVVPWRLEICSPHPSTRVLLKFEVFVNLKFPSSFLSEFPKTFSQLLTAGPWCYRVICLLQKSRKKSFYLARKSLAQMRKLQICKTTWWDWRDSEQASRRCATLECGSFWAESQLKLCRLRRNFCHSLNWLEDSKLGLLPIIRIIAKITFYNLSIWQSKPLINEYLLLLSYKYPSSPLKPQASYLIP